MFACLHGAGNLTALALEFSPLVEQNAPDTVILDTSGLYHLFGTPQDIAAAIARRARDQSPQDAVPIRIALAANPDAAFYAARGFSGISIIPHGDEAKYLGELPLSLLSPSDELRETLERWGIRRFRDLAALPPLGIAERLGSEGLHLRELARGEASRQLMAIQEPLEFAGQIELEHPVKQLEPLLFVLSRLLHGLAMRLATRALAANELRLHLRLEQGPAHDRTLRLPVPSLEVKTFLKLIQLDLETHPPGSPVVHVRLEANPAKPRALQHGLYLPAVPDHMNLQVTVARIRAIVGEGRVGSPELIDTHRPDAFRMVDFGQAKPVESCSKPLESSSHVQLALNLFRPPRPANVTMHGGAPAYVAAYGLQGRVVDCAGPWVASGDWWSTTSWARDEWDVVLSDGALYRIYQEPRGWFVGGSYD